MEYRTLYAKTVADLRKIARQDGIKIPIGTTKMRIVELILENLQKKAADAPQEDSVKEQSPETAPQENQEAVTLPTVPKKRGRPSLKDKDKAEHAAPRAKSKKAKAAETENEPAANASEKSTTADQPTENKKAETVLPGPDALNAAETVQTNQSDTAPRTNESSAATSNDKALQTEKPVKTKKASDQPRATRSRAAGAKKTESADSKIKPAKPSTGRKGAASSRALPKDAPAAANTETNAEQKAEPSPDESVVTVPPIQKNVNSDKTETVLPESAVQTAAEESKPQPSETTTLLPAAAPQARVFPKNASADNGAGETEPQTVRELKPGPRFPTRNLSENSAQPSAVNTPRNGFRNYSQNENNSQSTPVYPFNGGARPDYAGRGTNRIPQAPDGGFQSVGNVRPERTFAPSNGYPYAGAPRGDFSARGYARGFTKNDADSAAEARNRFPEKDVSKTESSYEVADEARANDAASVKPEYTDINQQNSALTEMLQNPECPDGAGVLEIQQEGYGFLRAENFLPGPKDVYVSIAQIRRFGLRNGDYVEGKTRAQREGDRYVAMLYINAVNGRPPEEVYRRPKFEDLTPIYPDSRLRLEKKDGGTDLALRAIDLVAPIGKGQRGLIVSPPKAGKTVLLKKIANAITENYPDIHLIVLLIDERPEEVTDLQRSIQGEVVYSTFDEMPDNHTRLSEMTLDRAQRLVEGGRDVVILLDSITRLARAYNLVIPPTGRSLSGGLDPGALHKPKRFFGAARNIENGGSLTIIATALVETGSRMDDIIYEEFKGTGNMELHLDRKLSEKRIFPAVDLDRSGTRRDELLYDPGEAAGAMEMRRLLSSNGSQDNTEQFIELMEKTRTNAEFLSRMKGWVAVWQKEGYM